MEQNKIKKTVKALNEMSTKELREVVANLDYEIADDLYRVLWAKYVAQDLEDRNSKYENLQKKLSAEEIENLSNKFVFDFAHFDANISYWDNIENFLDEHISK